MIAKRLLIIIAALGLPIAAQAVGVSFESYSAYTSVKPEDCITVESDSLLPPEEREIDFYTGQCAGFGAYSVIVSGGDARYNLDLKYKDTLIELDKLMSFHDLGSDKVEWRYIRLDNKSETPTIILSALITTASAKGCSSFTV